MKSILKYLLFRILYFFGKTPVVILQMGKVASTTIFKSLQKYYRGPIIHTHAFRGDHHDKRIRFLYQANLKNKPLKVITLVREPITRNISAFFQTFKRRSGVSNPEEMDMNELIDLFINEYPHDIPLTWFQKQIETNFDIDVFKTPFPKEGWSQIDAGHLQLLIMYHDLDDEKKQEILSQFIGSGNLKLKNENVGQSKSYGDTYRIFLERVKFPPYLGNRLIDSDYTKHFFSESVRMELRRKWIQSSSEEA